eukprot:gene21747-27802_t
MSFFTDRPVKPKFSSKTDDDDPFGNNDDDGFGGFGGLDSAREDLLKVTSSPSSNQYRTQKEAQLSRVAPPTSTFQPRPAQPRSQNENRISGSASPIVRPVTSATPNIRATPSSQQQSRPQFKPSSFTPSSNKFTSVTPVASPSVDRTTMKKVPPSPQYSPSSEGKHSAFSSRSASPSTTDSECSSLASDSSAASPMQTGHLFSSADRPAPSVARDAQRQQRPVVQPSFTPRVAQFSAVPAAAKPERSNQSQVSASGQRTSSAHRGGEVNEAVSEEHGEEAPLKAFEHDSDGINPMHSSGNVSCVTPTASASRADYLREYMRLSQEAPSGRNIAVECEGMNLRVDGMYAALDGLRAVYGQMRGSVAVNRQKMAATTCRLLSEDPLHGTASSLLALKTQALSIRTSLAALKENESGVN